MITVYFEDHGQDFLEFDIENQKIVGCRPFQGSIWCGLTTSAKTYRRGQKVTLLDSAIGKLTIRYPLVRVTQAKGEAR